NSVQNAFISRNMQFRKLFLSSITASSLSVAIGVTMACLNYGVWALVTKQIVNHILITISLLYVVNWRPEVMLSLKRLKDLMSYGWKLLVASLIDTLYKNLSSLIIGKMFNPSTLGYYNRGKQFPDILVTNINGSIQSVIFPMLATEQDNLSK